MKYKYTDLNICSLLHEVGMLNEDEIVTFFANETPPKKIKYTLRKLTNEHQIRCETDVQGNKFYYPLGYTPVNDELKRRRLLAFWAVAGMGSQEVTDVFPIRYPQIYYVICNTKDAYDFSVIDNPNEARIAARVNAESVGRDIQDTTIHIAVLFRADAIETLRPVLIECGFDGWCYIDFNTKQPIYEMFD